MVVIQVFLSLLRRLPSSTPRWTPTKANSCCKLPLSCTFIFICSPWLFCMSPINVSELLEFVRVAFLSGVRR